MGKCVLGSVLGSVREGRCREALGAAVLKQVRAGHQGMVTFVCPGPSGVPLTGAAAEPRSRNIHRAAAE